MFHPFLLMKWLDYLCWRTRLGVWGLIRSCEGLPWVNIVVINVLFSVWLCHFLCIFAINRFQWLLKECFGTCVFFVGRGTKRLGAAVVAHCGWRGEDGWMPVVPLDVCFYFPFFCSPSHSRYFFMNWTKAENLSNNVVKNMLPLLCGGNNSVMMSLKFCSNRPYFVYFSIFIMHKHCDM